MVSDDCNLSALDLLVHSINVQLRTSSLYYQLNHRITADIEAIKQFTLFTVIGKRELKWSKIE